MESFNATVGHKGRITIPTKIRTKLGIEDGDSVQVELQKLVPSEEAE